MFWLTSTESLKPDIYLYTYIKQRFVFFFTKETWILYRGNKHGVSKIVREAYQNYGDMEFGKKNRAAYVLKDGTKISGISLADGNRNIKLISIANKGKENKVCKKKIYLLLIYM